MHQVAAEILTIVETHLGGGRSAQTRIGPSGLGTDCDRCLVHGLWETPQQRGRPSWYAGAGTFIHQGLEIVMAHHELDRIREGGEPRWLCETRVTVGDITNPHGGDEPLTIAGTCDLFDAQTGAVVDYKTAGNTALKEYRQGKIKPRYVAQMMLYGLGMENAGHTVNDCTILAIPRNGATLGECASVTIPYDREAALAVLARADAWAANLAAYGVDAVLNLAGVHTMTEISCGTYGDIPDPVLDAEHASMTAQDVLGL